MTHLPIHASATALLDLIDRHPVVICVGETGSGKTTQIPSLLVDHFRTRRRRRRGSRSTRTGPSVRVAVTQPRRVAARSVAERVAAERNVKVGEEVGYKVRFDDRTSLRHTSIKYMTDGCLVRECLNVSDLSTAYDAVMLDEAHERSVHTDILLGLLKSALRKGCAPKLIVASATLDTKVFSAYFDDAPILRVEGRTYPVDVYHAKKRRRTKKSTLEEAVDVVTRIHREEDDGHVLLFLTGQKEIETACALLRDAVGENAMVLPLYGALRSSQQRRVFVPLSSNQRRRGVRKIVVCTNIAETSVTVPGVRYVVDPGFVKLKTYAPDRGAETLVVTPISQTSAQQRSGRAGRTAPGKCFRLYSKATYDQFPRDTVPEIRRSNLASVVLYLKVLGIRDVMHFDFLDPPRREHLLTSLTLLHALNAIDDDGTITTMGRQMASFPLDPCLSRCVVAAARTDNDKIIDTMVTIAAMLSVGGELTSSPRRGRRWTEEETRAMTRLETYAHPAGDHLSYVRIYNAWIHRERDVNDAAWCEARMLRRSALNQAVRVRAQLSTTMAKVCREHTSSADVTLPATSSSRHDRDVSDRIMEESIGRLMCAGYFMNAAKMCGGTTFRTMGGKNGVWTCEPHPTSFVLSNNVRAIPTCVVYVDLVRTSKSFMRHVVAVRESWVRAHAKRVERVDPYRLSATKRPPTNTPTVGESKRPRSREVGDAAEGRSKRSRADEKKDAARDRDDAIRRARERYLSRRRQQREEEKTCRANY